MGHDENTGQTITFTLSVARSTVSVSLSSFDTYFFANENFNEYHGSIKRTMLIG
jgi:hypothetical protein